MSPEGTQNNGSYNEEAEDMEYRLRTGEVVDESTYPMAPHMRSEEARRQTFSSWPPTAPVRPRDLAQAGLYYLGECDRVQCFCCGGILGGWEAGDAAWGEHTKHFPYCFFILGHDVGNIPFEGTEEEEEDCRSSRHGNTQDPMGSFDERLASFANIQHPIDHERLARAGFYSTGRNVLLVLFLQLPSNVQRELQTPALYSMTSPIVRYSTYLYCQITSNPSY